MSLYLYANIDGNINTVILNILSNGNQKWYNEKIIVTNIGAK